MVIFFSFFFFFSSRCNYFLFSIAGESICCKTNWGGFRIYTCSFACNTFFFHFVSSRENLHLLEEGQGLPREELDERIAREEFRRPRESLLNICTEFYKHCGPRLKILQNLAGEPRVTSLELLDVKSHMRYSTGFLLLLVHFKAIHFF